MNRKIKTIGLLVILSAIAVIGYIFLHELGHVIVMLYAGAAITDFSILHAHVSAVNGQYTDFTDLWLNANGMLLPLIVSFLWMIFYRKDFENTAYRIASYLIGLLPASSLLAWVYVPFLFRKGKAPAGDDITKFLYNFSKSHNPLVVSAAALYLISMSLTLMFRKKIIANFITEMNKMKGTDL